MPCLQYLFDNKMQDFHQGVADGSPLNIYFWIAMTTPMMQLDFVGSRLAIWCQDRSNVEHAEKRRGEIMYEALVRDWWE